MDVGLKKQPNLRYRNEAMQTTSSHTAVFKGQPLTDFPQDLYIPPDALEVFLETFEGPLDLLLYLIKKQNLEILDISVAELTRQYQAYIDLMQVLKLELAAEYLYMSALLIEIKSRLLLPKPTSQNPEEEDPRAELIRRLQEYERCKAAAEKLDQIPRTGRDVFPINLNSEAFKPLKQLPPLQLEALLSALRHVLHQANLRTPHLIHRNPLSVRERMTCILSSLQNAKTILFVQLFNCEEGRLGVVVTFVAILELLKQSIIQISQTASYGDIHVGLI